MCLIIRFRGWVGANIHAYFFQVYVFVPITSYQFICNCHLVKFLHFVRSDCLSTEWYVSLES